jgi:hypothetical protein
VKIDLRGGAERIRTAVRDNPRGAAAAVATALAAIGLAAGGYLVGSARFSPERAKATRDEATYRTALLEIRDERTRRGKLDAGIQSFVDRTLGGTAEACDAQLRSRLNRLGEEVGLRDLRVTTGSRRPSSAAAAATGPCARRRISSSWPPPSPARAASSR